MRFEGFVGGNDSHRTQPQSRSGVEPTRIMHLNLEQKRCEKRGGKWKKSRNQDNASNNVVCTHNGDYEGNGDHEGQIR